MFSQTANTAGYINASNRASINSGNVTYIYGAGSGLLAPYPKHKVDQTFFGVPDENNTFIERPEIFNKLSELLGEASSPHRRKIVVLKGLGGMGKTQLMLRYCYYHNKEYEFVFWLNAENWTITFDSLRKLAINLGIDPALLKEKNAEDTVFKWVRSWLEANTNWLLLLDNVGEKVSENIFDILPSKGGHILITTREHISSRRGKIIEIGKMTEEEAMSLLLQEELETMDPQSIQYHYAHKVVVELDCMPLAIDLARAYMKTTRYTFKGYLVKFKKQRKEIYSYHDEDSANTYRHTIETVWAISLEQLNKKNPISVRVLEACAFLHSDEIPTRLFEHCYSIFKAESSPQASTEFEVKASDARTAVQSAISVLINFSFVSLISTLLDEDGIKKLFASVRIHRLVQKVIYDAINIEDKVDWAKEIAHALERETLSAELYELYDPVAHSIIQPYIAHIRYFVALLGDMNPCSIISDALYNVTALALKYLTINGIIIDIEKLAKFSLKICTSLYGSEHSNTAFSHYSLGYIYAMQNKYKEAEILYRKSLSIREKLEFEHPDTACTLNCLAALYERSDKYEQAESVYHQALAIVEKTLGSEHPNTAATLNNLALVYKSQGKSEQARLLYERALSIFEKMLGPEDSYTATTLDNLTTLYSSQGKYKQAESFYQHALATVEEKLGPEHPTTATVLENLAMLYSSQDKYDQVETLYQRALTIRKKVLGPGHPSTATALDNLAAFYSSQGKYEQAELLHRNALEIIEKEMGEAHHDTATTLNNLAALYVNQGKYEEAEMLFRRSLRILQNGLRSEHSDTAITLNNLAVLYRIKGKYDLAELLHQQALTFVERELGSEHPSIATVLDSLAHLYSIQGKLEKAESLYQRALAIVERVLGPEHSSTATTLYNLAALYSDQGKYERAESLRQRALVIVEKALGPEHPDTASTLCNLATLYEKQGKQEQAESLYQRALSIREKKLGSEHPETACTLNNLAALYTHQGKYELAEPLYQRALKNVEKCLGSKHHDTAAVLNNLAALYSSQNKYDQAELFYQRALAVVENILGLDHPDTITTLNNLAALYKCQGKYDQAEPLHQRALEAQKKKITRV
ncbi:uncharacterized protein VTP21DRAFT_9796 [Calcarisporiella thermophila]|uniref:uncharacterized protein n=1 Tax=Calcarisporiella thermophila TaxID=911321 RepID=UPI003743FAEB